MEMIYDPRVQPLEGKISYGTLGLLNTLTIRANDNDHHKRNIFLINGATIVRNCFDRNKTQKEVLDQVSYEAEQIRHFFEAYVTTPSVAVFYFNPDIRKEIPEFAQKQTTESRDEIDRLTKLVAESENLKPDQIAKIGTSGKVTYYGLLVKHGFAYQYLTKALKGGMEVRVPKIWLASHCPFDFFILDEFPGAEILESHTGRILGLKDISTKIFKDATLPFNRTTYRLFGDKEFVKPAIRNKPKAISLLAGVKLKTKTEREILGLAKTKLAIDQKALVWRI